MSRKQRSPAEWPGFVRPKPARFPTGDLPVTLGQMPRQDGQAWRGEWDDARADRVRALRACVDATERFRAMIAEDIRTVRAAAKLDPDVQLPF